MSIDAEVASMRGFVVQFVRANNGIRDSREWDGIADSQRAIGVREPDFLHQPMVDATVLARATSGVGILAFDVAVGWLGPELVDP